MIKLIARIKGKVYKMNFLPRFLFNCSVLLMVPVAAQAAGTYYTGNYQSPQRGYSSQSYTQRSRTTSFSQQGVSDYNRNQYAKAGYSSTRTRPVQQQGVKTGENRAATQTSKSGFSLGAGISRQTSMWQFEMKESGSILHYDNVDWNVFDVNAKYGFVAGNTPLQVTAGFKYGMQAGEATMVDDDITNGGYLVTEWVDTDVCEQVDANGECVRYKHLGNQMGNTLSLGASKDGSMMEFNAGFGLTDFMQWGRLKVTPSIGWRYLKYKLDVSNNHGVSVDTFSGQGGCFKANGTDEVQCDPVVVFYFYNASGNLEQYLVTRDDTNGDGVIDGNDEIKFPTGAAFEYVSSEGTFFFEQPGISHSYEVEWSGPYLALDMLYDINQNNAVNAYLELGLPSYTSTGDQPYRFDWQHPKSVMDEGGIGSAFHLGMGASWSTAITDAVALSVGVTYDYYSVGDADATTYLNGDFYMGLYNDLLAQWTEKGYTEADMINPKTGDPIALNILQVQEDCPGWVCKVGGEIESFYKSLGVRVGINAKF